MSLLWIGQKKKKPLIIQRQPSPTKKIKHGDSARNPVLPPDCAAGCESVCDCSIKGISLSASEVQRNGIVAVIWHRVFSFEMSAGMTVEASVLLPLFLLFFLNLGCAIAMIRLHGNVQMALWQTGTELSVYGYAVYSGELPEDGKSKEAWWKNLAGKVFASTYVKARLTNFLGEDYLNEAPLTKGAEGLQMWESRVYEQGDEMDLLVTYAVSPWSSLAGFLSFRMANRYYTHIWNGYGLSEAAGEEAKTVYLAENGVVYHLDRDCTHLRFSVRKIPWTELGGARNQYGRRYRACEKCIGGALPDTIYITQEGNRYHYSRECSGLKRTVSSVRLEDTAELRPCGRCGTK